MSSTPAHANPFATHRVHSLKFRNPTFSWQETVTTISKMNYTGAVVGPKGSGKTTFLLELKKHLSEKGFETSYALLRADHNNPYNEALRQLGVPNLLHSIIILDGAEQFGFVSWQRFLIRTRLRRGLIISSHSTRRLPTLLECSTSLPLLQELVKQLCPDGYSELDASLPELFERHKGNIRMCLRDLYDYGIYRKPKRAAYPLSRQEAQPKISAGV